MQQSGAFGSGGFGSVNLKGPRSPQQSGFIWRERATYVELLYEFVTGDLRTPVRIPHTYLTFFDFDAGTSRFFEDGRTSDTIVEAVQGPCKANQELVADSAAILSVNNILASDLSAHLIPREERMICKCKAVLLVHACLEARSGGAGNHKVHKDIGASLEPRNGRCLRS